MSALQEFAATSNSQDLAPEWVNIARHVSTELDKRELAVAQREAAIVEKENAITSSWEENEKLNSYKQLNAQIINTWMRTMGAREESLEARGKAVTILEGEMSARETAVALQKEEIEACENDLAFQKEEVLAREKAMAIQKGEMSARECAVTTQEGEVSAREKAVAIQKEEVSVREKAVTIQEEKVSAREKALAIQKGGAPARENAWAFQEGEAESLATFQKKRAEDRKKAIMANFEKDWEMPAFEKDRLMKIMKIREEFVAFREETMNAREESMATREAATDAREEAITAREERVTTREEAITAREEGVTASVKASAPQKEASATEETSATEEASATEETSATEEASATEEVSATQKEAEATPEEQEKAMVAHEMALSAQEETTTERKKHSAPATLLTNRELIIAKESKCEKQRTLAFMNDSWRYFIDYSGYLRNDNHIQKSIELFELQGFFKKEDFSSMEFVDLLHIAICSCNAEKEKSMVFLKYLITKGLSVWHCHAALEIHRRRIQNLGMIYWKDTNIEAVELCDQASVKYSKTVKKLYGTLDDWTELSKRMTNI